jgi:transposase InsO family protein
MFFGGWTHRAEAVTENHHARWLCGLAPRRARSVKYEEVYLKAYELVGHAGRSIGDYINLYNQRRPHSILEDRTPDEAYFATLPAIRLAA